MKKFEYLLDFWFGDNPSLETKRSFWFKSNPETDAEILEKFEDTLLLAKENQLTSWKNNALSRLSLIILCDQFPRNIYRKNPLAFAFDGIALENCLEGLEQKQDENLILIQKQFFYMPLMHSEDLKIQELSLKKFHQLTKEQSGSDDGNEYAQEHYDIILEFGRFPHRNEVLGRKSTPAELEYLKTAERFGQ